MADPAIQASYRRAVRTDLHRIWEPFQIGAQRADTGTALHIASLGVTSPSYLDADVMTARVNLAPSTKGIYRGTVWTLQHNEDGTWSLLNQGQAENMLAGSSDSVTLGRPTTAEGMARFATTRWLLYHDIAGFRLRPAMRASGWLRVRDGNLVLSRRDEMAGPWLYWGFQPLPMIKDEDESVPEVLA